MVEGALLLVCCVVRLLVVCSIFVETLTEAGVGE